MKILFLHLSDLHMKNRECLNDLYINRLVESLTVVGDFNKLIIVISGDCASTGSKAEYRFVKYFVGILISRLKSKFEVVEHNYVVVVVPGNHDLNCSKSSISAKELNYIYKENQYDKEMPSEVEKLENFFDFSKYNRCFIDDALFDQKIISYGNFSIQFNLINTALFSLVHDEDKGLHYLPNHIIDKMSEPSDSSLIFTVMHHAPEWFCDYIKHKLMEKILEKSSIVFYGHEHFPSYIKNIDQNNQTAVMLCGGSLCNNSDWTDSAFFAGILDVSTYDYSIWRFNLDMTNGIYKHTELGTINLPSKNKSFIIKPEYEEEFCLDAKHPSQKDFRTRFVFPRLRDNNDEKEITTYDEFESVFEDSKRMIVSGSYNSGRTFLLKDLFYELSKRKTVIYIDADSISGSKIDKIIKNAFEEIYGEEDSAYVRFQQLPKDEKVLIFDNVDRIKSTHFKYFFEKVESLFGYYILGSKQTIELDVFERIKKEIGESKDISRYKLTPWYRDKRKQLIRSVAETELHSGEDVELIAHQLDSAIKTQQMFSSLTPDFITQFVEFYCKNLSQLSGNDSGVFGKVFEGNLITSIQNNLIGSLSVDKVFTLLSRIAYFIHKNQKYPIDEFSIVKVISDYNEEYGDNTSPYDIINILLRASVMSKNDVTNLLQFTNRSYLSFFVAKEINRKFNEDRDDTDIKEVIEFSCYDINADILLFLIYITENKKILDLILEMAKFYTDGWEEYSLSKSNIDYLNGVVEYNVEELDLEAIEKIDEEIVEEEKAKIQSELLSSVNVYDYPNDSSEAFLNKIFRSISLLTVISRCLPNFEHMMKRDDKQAFVDMIYRLPNKIFFLWAKSVDEEKGLIIEFVKKALTCEYQKQIDKQTEAEIKEKAVELLVVNSANLLLDIYNTASLNASKENTLTYLSAFDYKSDDSYSLEHLMMLCNRNRVEEFINEAERILKDSKHPLSKGLTQRVANYALHNMRGLNRNSKARLVEKCFHNNSNKNLLMVSNPKE